MRGIPFSWEYPRKILHYTSKDLWNWTFAGEPKLASDRVIDACIIRLPDGLKEHTERVDILMGQPFSARTNCAVVTYQDQLSISFASCIRETDVERLFFTRLVQDHIHVKIETNRSQ